MSKRKTSANKPSKKASNPNDYVKDQELVEKDFSSDSDGLLKKVFWGSFIFMGLVTIFMALGSGLNADEYWQDLYAERYIKWYETMGSDTSAFYHPKGPVQHYGALFELIAGYSNQTLGLDNMDPGYYDVRHFWVAIFGILAMLMVGLFTKTMGGWRAGLLALWMIFLSPRFLGHSLMNPKDIPFAAGYAMMLYFLAITLKTLPKPSIKTLLGLAGGIAIGVGVRPGGLLFAAIAGMFIAIEYLMSYGLGALGGNMKLTGNYLKYGLVTIIGGIFLGFLFWPYALVDPFNHVPESFKAVSDFAVNIRMVFNGDFVFSQEIPSYYTSLWMLLTVPLFVLIGFFGFFAFGKGIFNRYPRLLLWATLFSFAFPIIFVVIGKSPMYDGWRHMIFPYVAMVSLAALTWDYAYEKFKGNKAVVYVMAAILGITGLESTWFIARNYQMPYVYFNPLAGGVSGAYGSFEVDYWGVSAKQAVDWMEDEGILSENMQDTLVIGSDYNYALERYLKRKYGDKISIRYVKYRQRYDLDWDYAIFGTRFLEPKMLEEGNWPTKRAIHTVKVGDVPVMAVYKDEDNFAYESKMAFNKGDNQTSIDFALKELEVNPLNEIAIINIANGYLNTSRPDDAEKYIKMYDQLVPDNYLTQNLYGSYFMQKNDVNQAISAFEKGIELSKDNAVAYYYLGYIYMTQQKLNEALDMALKSVEKAPKFKQGYLLAAQVYEALGDANTANAYKNAAAKL
ncbi:MAG: tetratricopeptide repeat protein [Saprospiraceae bacterium]